jgi:glycosyltransferase involved in cell wall biosynthesis
MAEAMDIPAVSVVIPVFRTDGAVLAELCGRIEQTLTGLVPRFEIILVDDSGEAAQWETIRALEPGRSVLRGLRLGRNYGQHSALLAGIRAARGAVIVTLDDDLQSSPEDIPKLLIALERRDVDVVYGLPTIRRHGPWRNFGAAAFRVLLGMALGARIARMVSPFRAFRRDLREGFADYRGRDVVIDVLLGWSTNRFATVPVDHRPREHGRSGYSLRKLVDLGITMAVGVSALPLRLSSLAGLILAMAGCALLAYLLILYFVSPRHVPGFTFIASIVIVFSGVQLVCLGIVGEYLARLHFRVLGQPTYVVRERMDVETGAGERVTDDRTIQS